MKCCICGKEIKGHKHNARPLFDGSCCDDCNILVIQERLDRRTTTNNSCNNQCSKCMECCTDFIPMTLEEIDRIKSYMSTHDVQRNFCTDSKGNYKVLCPFLSEEGCQIYEVRPAVCRGFCCWKSSNNIKRNKIKCIVNADFNGVTNFASLHAIFWDDWAFHTKLVQAIFDEKGGE